PTSAEVFVAIRDHFERHPDVVKLGTTFLFKLTDPASAWTLACKGDKASVTEGAGDKPDVTLELANSDFLDMTSGKADPQKLYFGGKLKISGNVMASQKLEFLKKMDPAAGMAAILKHRGAAAPKAASAAPKDEAAPAAAKASEAPAFFAKLKERLAKSPELGKELGAVVQFKLTAPASSWVVDPALGVKEGTDAKATTTLTLPEEELLALARGTESAQRLFQTGKLRVDGDVRVATRLGILKGLS
ncbi:MAG TPA: SCP2 sterol-binding domain-containing protein, partial [Polyangiaceae bacterium]